MDMAKRKGNKSNGATDRPKPIVRNPSLTRDGKRRYGCGGKIKKGK